MRLARLGLSLRGRKCLGCPFLRYLIFPRGRYLCSFFCTPPEAELTIPFLNRFAKKPPLSPAVARLRLRHKCSPIRSFPVPQTHHFFCALSSLIPLFARASASPLPLSCPFCSRRGGEKEPFHSPLSVVYPIDHTKKVPPDSFSSSGGRRLSPARLGATFGGTTRNERRRATVRQSSSSSSSSESQYCLERTPPPFYPFLPATRASRAKSPLSIFA